MQKKWFSLIIVLLLFTVSQDVSAQSQGTQFYSWSSANHLADRMEIKTADNFLTLSGASKRYQKRVLELADSIVRYQSGSLQFTPVDYALMQRMLDRFGSEEQASLSPRFPDAGFVKSAAAGFKFELNPVLGIQHGMEKDGEESRQVFFQSIGATASGEWKDRFSFQLFAAGIRENVPAFIDDYILAHNAVPGATRYGFKNNEVATWMDLRGNVAAQVTPFIRAELGYDRIKVGNGYRSLYYSDFGPSQLYFKLDTRVWRLNYTNYFMKLSPSADPDFNKALDNKYAVMHRLSMNVLPWLQFGIFENIIFGRSGGYDISYLQPVIFLRSIEQQNGSPDNANLGGDFKITVAKTAQVYGQVMLDEFLLSEVFGDRNWWGNKQGIQLGAKWIDALTIPNLDLQAEFNNVRPFMYQFRNHTGNYTHYGQPLAHPLGANFREMIGVLNYRPLPSWNVNARINYWNQGTDSLGANFGLDPNENYNTRLRSYYYPMFAGGKMRGINGSLTIGYEPFQDAIVELNVSGRRIEPAGNAEARNNLVFSLGFRMNMYRRDFDF